MTTEILPAEALLPIPDPDVFPPPGPFPEPGPAPKIPDPFRPIPELEKIRWPIKYGPATVKILIVTDNGGAYDQVTNFGLGLMLKDAFNVGTPAGTPLPADYPEYARFEFTLAHRGSGIGTTPGFNNFVFSTSKLNGFHEVWLFGVSATDPYVQGTQLDALVKFMNNGGGVLAMGDHEDLGLGLCGNVPRVKSMRKWWFQSPLPAGEQRAPDSDDLTRNDTVQLIGGADPGSNGQEDATPQRIRPNYKYGYNWWRPQLPFRYPHPVLCGPRGVINVFPDHAHEGDCIVPSTLNASEYPGGIAPEVVARGRNVVGRTKSGYTIVNPREFGLLGAYDGHLPAAKVGRVIVDSTWHHWFNINLRGMDATPHSVQYKDILAYFRNVAIWLAPKERQERMRLTGKVIVLFTQYMIERTLTIRQLLPEAFYPIGIEARDALGRLAPKCQVNAWLLEWLSPHVKPALERAANVEFDETKNPSVWEAYVLDRLTMTALGGAMSALAVALRESDYREGDAVIDAADKIAAKGLRAGIKHAEAELAASCKELQKAVTAACSRKEPETALV